MSTSISAPFTVRGGSIVSTKDVVKQTKDKLLNVLVTGKYERVGLAQYGAGIQQLLFGNVGDLEMADWKVDAAAEISRAVSGVQIIDLTVTPTSSSEATVSVYYRTPLTSGQTLSFNISADDILTEESPL